MRMAVGLLVAACLLSTMLTYLAAASLESHAASLDSPAASLNSPGCYATAHAGVIALVCAGASGGSPGKDCCSSLLQTAKGGLRCLCQAAASPDLLSSGLTAGDVLEWYKACGGHRPVNLSDLVSTCQDRLVVPGGYSISAEASLMDLSTPTPMQGIPPPPPVNLQEPKVLLVEPDERHQSVWPWILLALGVLAFIAMITWVCCLGCGMIIRLVTDLGRWIFNMARNQAPQRVGPEGSTSVTVPAITAQPEPLPPLIVLAEEVKKDTSANIFRGLT